MRDSLRWTCIGPLLAACPGLQISHSTCNKLIFRFLFCSVLQVTHLTLHLLVQRTQSPAFWAVCPLSPAATGGGVWRGPAPPPPCLRPQAGGERVFRSHELPARQLRSGPLPPPSSPLPAVPATATGRLPVPLLQPRPPRHCLHPGLGRGPRRSRPPRRAPGPRTRARAMGLWLPPPPAPPG